MKNKNRKYQVMILGLITCLFFLSAVSVSANEGKEHDKKEWKEKRAKMFDQLDLSEEQRQALKAHRKNHRDSMKGLREQIKTKRQEYRKSLSDLTIDEATLTAANNEVKKLTNTMADHRLKGILEVRKILTPEQYKKFNEIKEKHKKKHKNHKKNGHKGSYR